MLDGLPSTERDMANGSLDRFFGGSPAMVIVRLILLSIVIGVLLSALGLDPWNIVESVERLIRWIYNLGWDAVRWLWRYFILGAVLVIPIWLIVRVFRTARGS
jgi:Na+/H+ antiporter NhaC